jgi:hypothetical protein
VSKQLVSSEASRWDRILGRLTNIVVLLAGLMTLAIGVRYLTALSSSPSRADAPLAQRAVAPGQTLSVKGVDWAASSGTIVLALSPTCHFCLESNGFYKDLTARANERGRVRVVALFSSESVGQDYVRQHDLAVAQVASAQSTNITATPTLLFVNNRGQIDKVWLGKLQPGEEKAVMALLD